MMALARFHKELHQTLGPLIYALQADDPGNVILSAQGAIFRLADLHQQAVQSADRVWVAANREVWDELAYVVAEFHNGCYLLGTCLVEDQSYDLNQYAEGVDQIVSAFSLLQ